MSERESIRYRVATPQARGAIAIIDITGDVDGACEALGLAPPAIGSVALRDLTGIDEGVVVRWTIDHMQVMPHGNPVIVEALTARLGAVGGVARAGAEAACWPEADDVIEAAMLEAISQARSPRAVDLLLEQPKRWRDWDGQSPPRHEVIAQSAALNHLVEPPLVVAIGGANIGKSTLINALAAREVSIVADEPGVTRDHVGVTLILDGLCVRWVDTPGLRETIESESERAALGLAAAVASNADLLVVCGDAGAPPPSNNVLSSLGIAPEIARLIVGLRSDLGPCPGAEIETSASTDPPSLTVLATRIREALTPDSSLTWPGAWAFPGIEGVIASHGAGAYAGLFDSNRPS